jgi:hypothetical protein
VPTFGDREGHKKPHKRIKKYLLIPSFNIVPTHFCATFTSLIQQIKCPIKAGVTVTSLRPYVMGSSDAILNEVGRTMAVSGGVTS